MLWDVWGSIGHLQDASAILGSNLWAQKSQSPPSLSPSPAAHPAWALGHWPLPGSGGPRGTLHLRLEFTHSSKHQTPMCLPLSFFLTEEGERVMEL